jgi:hypothetical protein
MGRLVLTGDLPRVSLASLQESGLETTTYGSHALTTKEHGEERYWTRFAHYREEVPMLFPNPRCVLEVLSKPIKVARG